MEHLLPYGKPENYKDDGYKIHLAGTTEDLDVIEMLLKEENPHIHKALYNNNKDNNDFLIKSFSSNYGRTYATEFVKEVYEYLENNPDQFVCMEDDVAEAIIKMDEEYGIGLILEYYNTVSLEIIEKISKIAKTEYFKLTAESIFYRGTSLYDE